MFLEGGGVTPSLTSWPEVFVADLARITTVCRYSRAGGSGSTAVPQPRTWAGMLDDANQLIDALQAQAAVEGPYIFLGWSFGGSVALGEVTADPSRVAGLAILDTDFPADFLAVCPASGRSKADCQAEYHSDIDALAVEAGIAKSVVPIPKVPIRIFTAMQAPDCVDPDPGKTLTLDVAGVRLVATSCASMLAKVADTQAADWGALSPDFEQFRVQTSHDALPAFAHAAIAKVITELVAASRGAG